MTGPAPSALLPVVSAANAVSGCGLVAAVIVAGSKESLTAQLGWLTLACACLLLAVSADVALLLTGRRRLAARRRLLVPPGPRVAPVGSGLSETPLLVVVPGGTRVHVADCPLVVGKAAAPAGGAQHEPCGMCRP